MMDMIRNEREQMGFDALLDLVRTRRSIRRFLPDPIPDGYVEQILEVARWAMSGANGQPWEFIVIKNQETKDQIASMFFEYRKTCYTLEKTRVEELRHAQVAKPPVGLPTFKDAPVIIAVCGDLRTIQA